MTTSDPVWDVLRAAIKAGDSTDLRVALARHLMHRGTREEALVEVMAGLSLDPASPDLLALRTELNGAIEGETVTAPVERTAPHVGREPRLRLAAKDGRSIDAADDRPRPVLGLGDVGGLDDVKGYLKRAFLTPLQHPDLYRRFGKRAGGGLIIYGPPGCGKTYVARALAGELGACFVSIGLSDVLDLWLGESERKLHELFEHARRNAPSLMFFDEIDALGQRRTQLRHSAGRNIVNQLLTELDGMGGDNENVFVLGATNHPWDVDAALRRPGRCDNMAFVPPPDEKAREMILLLHLDTKLVEDGIDLGGIVRRTEGYSGADLRAIVELATDLAIERTMSDGGCDHPIDLALLRAATDSTRAWFDVARNYALYANEGGTFDELLTYMRQRRLA